MPIQLSVYVIYCFLVYKVKCLCQELCHGHVSSFKEFQVCSRGWLIAGVGKLDTSEILMAAVIMGGYTGWLLLTHWGRDKNGCHFSDDIFKCIFLNENVWISIEISLKFVPKVPINDIPALVQIMAWRRPGDKPLSEPVMVSLLTHICVTQPQSFKAVVTCSFFSKILTKDTQ